MKDGVMTGTVAAMIAVILAGMAQAEVLLGLVEPNRDVQLSLPVPGRIARIHYREGDRVEAGAILVELDSIMEKLEIERRELIYRDTSELEAARARARLLEETLESTRRLHERTGSVSREDLSRAELEHTLARLDVKRLEQASERERVEYEMALQQYALRRIEAPFAGVVADLDFEEGESLHANQPVVRLVDDDHCYLTVHVHALRAALTAPGAPVRMRFAEGEPVVKTGTVAFISPVVDPASGLRRIRLEFLNDAPRVAPGVAGQWLQEDIINE